jgi:hypothetical protein
MENILGFVGHTIFFPSTQLYRVKAATEQCVSEHAWLYFNKTLLTKLGQG